MTTKKEKKSVKKIKSVKSGNPTGKTAKRAKAAAGRSKVVVKGSVSSEIDKEKMAAFFSAGGLKEPVAAEKAESEPAVPETGVSAPVFKAPVKKSPPPVTEKASELPAVTIPEVAGDKVVKKVVEEDYKCEEQNLKEQNLKEKKGETEMTTTEPVKHSSKESGSGTILPIFVILIFMAAFWLYYISLAPLQKAAATQMEQSQTQIQKLEKKVKSLQAVIAGLKNELKDLQTSAHPNRALTAKKTAPAKTTVKDSSFAKAPIPFWRNYQHPRTKQLEKLNGNKKKPVVTVKAPAADIDSFSKAPVPFWRKGKAAPSAAAVKDAHHDSSFDKAPIPFWRK